MSASQSTWDMPQVEKEIVDFCQKGDQNYKEVTLVADGLKFCLVPKRKKYKKLLWRRAEESEGETAVDQMLATTGQLLEVGKAVKAQSKTLKKSQEKMDDLLSKV